MERKTKCIEEIYLFTQSSVFYRDVALGMRYLHSKNLEHG